MPLADQAISFMWTVAIGMFAGLCYEIYKAVRDLLKLKKIGTFAGDIIFWLFLTVFSFVLLIKANYGQLRLYFFIGLLLGVFLFLRFLGGHSYCLFRWIFLMAGRFLRLVALFLFYVWSAVIFPFRIIFVTVAFPLRLVARLMGKFRRFTKEMINRPIRWSKIKICLFADRISKKFLPPK